MVRLPSLCLMAQIGAMVFLTVLYLYGCRVVSSGRTTEQPTTGLLRSAWLIPQTSMCAITEERSNLLHFLLLITSQIRATDGLTILPTARVDLLFGWLPTSLSMVSGKDGRCRESRARRVLTVRMVQAMLAAVTTILLRQQRMRLPQSLHHRSSTDGRLVLSHRTTERISRICGMSRASRWSKRARQRSLSPLAIFTFSHTMAQMVRTVRALQASPSISLRLRRERHLR